MYYGRHRVMAYEWSCVYGYVSSAAMPAAPVLAVQSNRQRYRKSYVAIQFFCRQCLDNEASPLLMNNLLVTISFYISVVVIHINMNFMWYGVHWMVFVVGEFRCICMQEDASTLHFVETCGIWPHPTSHARKYFLTKVGRRQGGYKEYSEGAYPPANRKLFACVVSELHGLEVAH